MATDLLPDSKEEQDSRYNPGALKAAETFPQAYAQGGIDQAEAFANDPSNSIKDQEETSIVPGGNINYTGTGGKQKVSGKAWFQKKGPISAIVAIVFGGGIGISFLTLPSLLPIHIVEEIVKKYDAQNTSFSIRANKVSALKITGDTTSGSCDIVKIACRFSRPSNSLLTKLESQGVKALDASGNAIDKKLAFPNQRPATYEFTDKTGKTTSIAAKDFYKTLMSNAELRAAFHNAYNPRFIGFSDSVFSRIQAKFGFSKKNELESSKSTDDVKKKINSTVEGNDTGAKAAASEGGDAAENTVKKLLSDEANASIKKVADSGKGNAIGLGAGLVCMIGDTPGIVAKTVRAYQLTQLIKYAMLFLTTGSAIKAGHGTPVQSSAVGNLLTETVNGKSAMDSIGMKHTLFGDSTLGNNSYQKFSPGGNVVSSLGNITKYASSDIKKQFCNVATNPATGAAIDLATSETVVVPIANAILGFALAGATEAMAPPLINLLMDTLKSSGVIKNLLNFFLGDLTQNLSGEDVGNALASGASNMMGQTANAGGNMPLTVQQAIAYNNSTQEVQLAYAQEDRATLSPFDASSSNTMMGSIVNQLLPYTNQLNSVRGTLSTIGSIVTNPFNSLSVAHAADAASQYTGCNDPAIVDSGVAAGPFCNIQYGIPPEYLDEDPLDVINSLGDANIDPNTGEPKGDLQKWMELCTDGSTDQAANCMIKDKTTAQYALYTIDHRVQKTMDGEDVDSSSSNESSHSTTDNSGNVNPNGWSFPTTAGASVVSPFGPRGAGFHTGVDLGIPSGSPFYATRDGVIQTREYNIYSIDGGAWCPVTPSESPIQKDIWITHTVDGQKYTSVYAHMSQFLKKTGDVVKAGDLIGYTGGSGCSSGPHVHFEIWKGNATPSVYGPGALDPLPLISGGK